MENNDNYMLGLKERFKTATKYLIQAGVIERWPDLSDILRVSHYAISNLRQGIEKHSTSDVLERFYIEYSSIINHDWLYEGKGEMLKYDDLKSYQEIIKLQRRQIFGKQQQIDSLMKFIMMSDDEKNAIASEWLTNRKKIF